MILELAGLFKHSIHHPICLYVIVRNQRSGVVCIGDTVCNGIHITPLRSTVTLSSGTTVALLYTKLVKFDEVK